MTRSQPKKRITFIQTGDFRAAASRIATTGEETYHAQRHSMAIVERLAGEHESVNVICTTAAEPYHERLESGVVTYGRRLYGPGGKTLRPVVEALRETAPTHVILRMPDADLLSHAFELRAKVLPSFADTIAPRSGVRGLLDRWRHRRLARLLNDPRIDVVVNHNLAASESLARIGVERSRIVPWDWPRPHRPQDWEPKTLPGERALKLLHIGTVSEAKGVGDALRALALLPAERARLTVVGSGEIEKMKSLAKDLELGERIDFRGQIPFAEVVPTMRAHDALIVFTRPDYAEGLPGVIYQALAARLPIILTPHPVFRSYFNDGLDVLVARSHEAKDLAVAIERLLDEPGLYERLSEHAETTFGNITLDTDWVDLVDHWIRDQPADRDWLHQRTLAACHIP